MKRELNEKNALEILKRQREQALARQKKYYEKNKNISINFGNDEFEKLTEMAKDRGYSCLSAWLREYARQELRREMTAQKLGADLPDFMKD